jgi:hypothetical protein
VPTHPSPHPRGGRRRAEKSSSLSFDGLTARIRSKVVLGGAALAVTGVVVGAGVLAGQAPPEDAATDLGAVVDLPAPEAAAAADRDPVVSRDDRRGSADPAKRARLVPEKPSARVETEQLSQGDPKDIARALLSDFGFAADQFGCLESLWEKESGWDPSARNPSSGAHGIPQALPGSKMASAGADWATNPVTQITWGLGYIQDRYGSPCSAWGHSQARGWY